MYTQEFAKEVLDFCDKNGLAKTLEKYGTKIKSSIFRWNKDLENGTFYTSKIGRPTKSSITEFRPFGDPEDMSEMEKDSVIEYWQNLGKHEWGLSEPK